MCFVNCVRIDPNKNKVHVWAEGVKNNLNVKVFLALTRKISVPNSYEVGKGLCRKKATSK